MEVQNENIRQKLLQFPFTILFFLLKSFLITQL